jgi:hypothetical protein
MTTRPPPRGIEKLLVAAASDPELAARLRDDPAATVAACTTLNPTEREVLAAVPPESLRQMVAAVTEGAQDRRSFLQQSGAMLGAFAAGGGGGGGFGGARADVPGSDVRLEEVKVRGPLSREIVRRLLHRNVNQVRYCYERERQRHPALAGKVTVGFSIKTDGTVAESAVKTSTVGNKELEGCIAAALRRWQFPKATAPVTVDCTYVMRPPRR